MARMDAEERRYSRLPVEAKRKERDAALERIRAAFPGREVSLVFGFMGGWTVWVDGKRLTGGNTPGRAADHATEAQ